jgi:hypothetical protein
MSTGLWILIIIVGAMVAASIVGYALTRAADDHEDER